MSGQPHIAPDDIRRIATLARLELDGAEVESLAREMESILGYIDILKEVDIEGAEPFLGAGNRELPFREDEPRDSLPRDAALGNAPEQAGGCFLVPPIQG